MRWVIAFIVGFFIAALTGELIQTQVLHNTTPIAQRGVTSDLVIGCIVWLIVAAVIFGVRSRTRANQQAQAQRESDADAARRAHLEAEKEAARQARPQSDLQNQIASRSFSEDISAPGFMEAWHRAYERLFHWEDDLQECIRNRHVWSDEVAQRYIEEAEERIERTIADWRSEHPDGPVPQSPYWRS